ncbi:MAG: sulfatase-like hydrolase/transferase [Acidobacteriota bacterium]
MFIKRSIHYLSAGLCAGLLLALVEAIDRLTVLAKHFSATQEKLLFICTLTFIPVANMVLGLLLAALFSIIDRLFLQLRSHWQVGKSPLSWFIPNRDNKFHFALALALPIMLVSILAPTIFTNGFRLMLVGISERITNISLLVKYSTLFLCVGIYFTALLLTWVDSEGFTKLFVKRWFATGLGLLAAIVAIAFYWIDARIFVGRYLYSFHLPLSVCAIAASYVFGHILTNYLKPSRAIVLLLAITVLIGTITGGYFFDQQQALKALFWRRGVIAKKYLAFAQNLLDLDRDGFSPLLNGGDCDDRNPTCNILAHELPNNSRDENCLGGDLKEIPPDFAELNQSPLPEQLARNVIFITIDCLRADHLSCYGYQRKLSPNIDRFAARAVLFENAFSLSTNTGHSFSGIARASYGETIFDDNLPTIAEMFTANGRVTAAITSPKTDKWLWKQGWESYKTIMLKGLQTIVHSRGGYWDSQRLTNETITFLRAQQNTPFYLWVHYNDLHAKNEKYARQGSNNFGNKPIDIYDSNIAYTDEQLGRLFEYLESSGLLDTTIVAISADHGEEFGEHGQEFHNGRPYREQTHVPLILWYPSAQPLRVQQPVSTIDLGPTFLRNVGILPPRDYIGLDLRHTINGLTVNRKIFCETPRNVPQGDFFAWAIVDGDWRLIYDQIGNTYELYNEVVDPDGRYNLIDQEKERALRLSTQLGQWLDLQSQHKAYRFWARF